MQSTYIKYVRACVFSIQDLHVYIVYTRSSAYAHSAACSPNIQIFYKVYAISYIKYMPSVI